MGLRYRVTELEVRDHPEAVVSAHTRVLIVARRELVEVEGPDDLRIEWNGDLGLNPEIIDSNLETRFAAGAHTVTAEGAAGGSSVSVGAWESEVEVVNGVLHPSGEGKAFFITDEPQMPVITARLRIIGPATATVNNWTCGVSFRGAINTCPNVPHFGVINDDLELTQAGGDQFTPNFDKVRGNFVGFSVRFTIGGQTHEPFGTGASILGTNPQQSQVQAALPHDTLRRIACRESGQRQFDAAADGGVSECPLYSSDRRGRVGIMQVPDPTPDHIWNWRLNVEKGIEIFNERVAAAGEYPSRVRNSEEFNRLVVQFNQRRQQQGLDPIQVILPEFTAGNFDGDDDLQQLELDAIRGYNGWHGSDRFGLELHEFRVAVNLIDGEEVLIVANINEETLQGEAAWERVPVADRPADIGSPDYVNDVLAFPARCEPGQSPVFVIIRAEDGTSPPCRILRTGASRTYRALVAPAGGTFIWSCGGAKIVGSGTAELVTIKGDVTSGSLNEVGLTVHYFPPQRLRQAAHMNLTVADVEKISVRVKASAAATPGRGPLADHQFDCTETAEAFPPDMSLILLRGDFEDVELQATVKPVGTPLVWDVRRASDDVASLGTGLPTLVPDAADVTRAKLKANETGSFFVRVFGDCGDKKFDPNVPFKLVPTVLVEARLERDETTVNPASTQLPQLVGIGGANYVQVQTGGFDIQNPGTAAIHMKATVNVMSGGANGRRFIEPFFATTVFAGWVNNMRADVNIRGSYTGGHAISQVFATNSGTGPDGMFRPGDGAPNLVAPPLLDAGWPNSGMGGSTVTLSASRIRPTDQFVGQQWIVEAVDSPSTIYPFLHPIFSTPAALVELRTFRFELHFSAHLCLWTNRSGGAVGGVAERSYGVLRSYNWDMLAEWNIDPATINITVVTPMSITISGGFTPPRLDRPTNARCEVCPPTAQNTRRRDGRI